MNKIFFALLKFVLAVFLLDRIAFYSINFVSSRSQYGASGGEVNYFMANAANFDTVVLGSSRPLRGVDPTSLGRGYNLSNSGLDVSYCVCLLDLLIEKGLAPKVAVVDFNPFEMHHNPAGYRYLRPYYGHAQKVTEYFDRFDPAERWRMQVFQSYRFNSQVPSILNNALRSARGTRSTTGWFPDKASPLDAERTRQTQANSKFAPPNPESAALQMEVLEDLVRVCEQGHVRLFLTSMPAFGSRGHEVPEPLRQFSARHPGLYHDFFYSAPAEFDDPNLWHDAQHFNLDGARKFSDRLALEIAKDS